MIPVEITYGIIALTDEMGIMVNLLTPVSILLTGTALGTNGTSTIALNRGLKLGRTAVERCNLNPCERSIVP